ncbi:MAG: hypothetical protein ACK5YC_09450, partial [Planctomyces sp.]
PQTPAPRPLRQPPMLSSIMPHAKPRSREAAKPRRREDSKTRSREDAKENACSIWQLKTGNWQLNLPSPPQGERGRG